MIKKVTPIKITQDEALEKAKNSIDNLLAIVKANDKTPAFSPVIEEKTTETVENLAIIQRYLIGYYEPKEIIIDLMGAINLAEYKQEYAISVKLHEILQKITEGE
ncbi:hypothetical protein, partial [Limosilactobacillus equigenerosi]